MGLTGEKGEDKEAESAEDGFGRRDEMRRIGLAAAVAAVAVWSVQEAPAQEAGSGIRCREAASRPASEGAAAVPAKREKKGLVLHYSFGRGGAREAGSVVKDLSGGGHDGRVEGDGLERVKGMGPKGGAARFDGKGDFIRVPRDAALEPEEVTVAAWVRVRKGDMWEAASTIAFKRNSSFHNNEAYGLELFPDRTARAVIAGPNAAQSRIQSTVPMADGVWHHVAMTHQPGETRLYIDGTLAGEVKAPTGIEQNTEADLLIGARDHAHYPLGNFGMFDLAEVKVWDTVLGAEDLARLHAARSGRPGVGAAGTDWKALAESGADQRLTSRGIVPAREGLPRCGELVSPGHSPRMFPPWTQDKSDGKAGESAELRALVAQGRRDRAASPEFLAALEGLAGKWERAGRAAADRLPMVADWRGEEWPAGWEAVRRDVWRFGAGEARQVESRADMRYVLFYEPGKAWTDYEATVRFESGSWFTPPMRSSAVLYFRYRGVDDSYSLWLDGAGDLSLISLDKERRGRQRILARTPVDRATVLDGKPWTVKVRGEEIEVWHGGKRYLFATDGAHPSGTVGVESVHIPMRFSGLEAR